MYEIKRKVDIYGFPLSDLEQETFEVSFQGERAMFTTPESKGQGCNRSYPIPTREALEQMVKGIYYHPTIDVVVDSVRIMNRIDIPMFNAYMTNAIKNTVEHDSTLVFSTYLMNPWYKVRFHLEWDYKLFPEFSGRYHSEIFCGKHIKIVRRYLKQGKHKRDIWFGTSECRASYEQTDFDADESYYDNSGIISFGRMYMQTLYPGEVGSDKLRRAFWTPEMINGIIVFPPKESIPPEDILTLGDHERREGA